MNLSFLRLHPRLITWVLTLAFGTVAMSVSCGDAKTWQQIDWLDVVGEGGITLMAMVWLFFILASRPLGQVTNLLTIGLSCFMVTCLLDVMDEVMHYDQAHAWLYWVESLPAPVGMILMTIGLYYWHQEQLTLKSLMHKREADFRQHQMLDPITRLYRADYLRELLGQMEQLAPPYCIAMVDIQNFGHINQTHGLKAGDELLRSVADTIVLNLRQTDIACRYAGDRFVLLLNQTKDSEARVLLEHLRNAINHQAFKPDQSLTGIHLDVRWKIRQANDHLHGAAMLPSLQEALDNTSTNVAVGL